jgi:hypothetical protein
MPLGRARGALTLDGKPGSEPEGEATSSPMEPTEAWGGSAAARHSLR